MKWLNSGITGSDRIKERPNALVGNRDPHIQMAQWSQSLGTDSLWVPRPVPRPWEHPQRHGVRHKAEAPGIKQGMWALTRRGICKTHGRGQTSGDLEATKIIPVPDSTFLKKWFTLTQKDWPCHCDRKHVQTQVYPVTREPSFAHVEKGASKSQVMGTGAGGQRGLQGLGREASWRKRSFKNNRDSRPFRGQESSALEEGEPWINQRYLENQGKQKVVQEGKWNYKTLHGSAVINIYRVGIMKTLNINKTPNYYLIIMEDGGRRMLSAEGGSGVWVQCVHTYVWVCVERGAFVWVVSVWVCGWGMCEWVWVDL